MTRLTVRLRLPRNLHDVLSVPRCKVSVLESSENLEGSGLIGLGPNYGSQVSDAIGDRSGDAVLDRIFLQNTSTPNYITFLLGRNNDPTDPPAGQFTVGELVPGYEAVTSQPKLPVSILSSNDNVNQHWQVLLDADGITGPAGENVIDQYDIETGVKSTSNKKQLTVSTLCNVHVALRIVDIVFLGRH